MGARAHPHTNASKTYPSQGDGWLDAVIGNGWRSTAEGETESATNQLHHNNGDGTFTPQTDACRFPFLNRRNARAVAFARWSQDPNDGLGLLVANHGAANELYRNVNGVFTLVSSTLSSDETSPTSAVAWGDFNVRAPPRTRIQTHSLGAFLWCLCPAPAGSTDSLSAASACAE